MLSVTKKSTKLISSESLLVIAEKVVLKYVYAGTIPTKEMEDVKMAIIEKFLNKESKIVQGFKGESKVTTYCIAILNRMCCEIIRRDLKHWDNYNNENENIGSTSHLSTSEQLIINDEINLLKNLFVLLGHEEYKFIVFLAYYYQFQPNKSYVSKYDINYIENKLINLLSINETNSKGHIFNVLSNIVNLVEFKEIKPDAVRMWLNKTIDKLILRLNGSFNRANYNKESLQILFEYYYFNNKNHNKKGN